jgi:zinc protease
VPQITVQAVNALAKEWITEKNRVVVVEAPEKPTVKVPDNAEMAAVFAQVKAKVSRTRIAWAAQRWYQPATLGRTVPKKRQHNRHHRVAIPVERRARAQADRFPGRPGCCAHTHPGGTSLVPDSDFVRIDGLAADRSHGIGSFSAIDLSKVLAGKVARVAPYIDEREEGFSGQASPRDLETLFQLVYLNATAPRRDSTAYQSLKTRLAAVLENQSASPESAFRDTIEVTLAQHHFRARPFTVKTLDEIDMERALAVYRDRFADASDFTFVLVGSFAHDSVEAAGRQYLGALPAKQRRENYATPAFVHAGVVKKQCAEASSPKHDAARIHRPVPIHGGKSHRPPMSRSTFWKSGCETSCARSLSGTYGVEVGHSTSREPTPTYDLDIIRRRSRVDSLTKTVFREIAALKTTGVKPDEIAKVKGNTASRMGNQRQAQRVLDRSDRRA